MNRIQQLAIYILGMIIGITICFTLDTTERDILEACKRHAKVELAGVTVVCATEADLLAKQRRTGHV